jgi:hypothetical protein
VQIGGVAVGDGRPGDVYQRLIATWSQKVGVDVAAQALAFAVR